MVRTECGVRSGRVAGSIGLLAVLSPFVFAGGGEYGLSTLDGAGGFRVLHNVGNAQTFGRSVAGVGDVNGDGVEDFVVGAFKNSGSGSAYLFFGHAGIGPSAVLDFANLAAGDGHRLTGPSGERIGHTISRAGDLNGDGFEDFAVGAPLASPAGRPNAGKVYVVYGRSSFGPNPSVGLNPTVAGGGFVVFGAAAGDQLGSGVGGGGDWNGDGFDDLVIGSPGAAANGGSDAGRAWVLLGSPTPVAGGVIDLQSPPATAIRVDGPGTDELLGASCAMIGDINQDGSDDIAIGAPGAPSLGKTGHAYVVFGGGAGVVDTSQSLAGIGFSVDGAQSNDELGASVAGAGDWNGDGVVDLVVGIPNGDGLIVDSGMVAIVHGGPTVGAPGVVFLQQLTGSVGLRILGTGAGDRVGESLAGVGDINGDGAADLLIGAPDADSPLIAANGEVSLLYGGPAVGASGDFSLGSIDGANGLRFSGIESQHELGAAVGGGSDIDADGRPDLLLAAWGADEAPSPHEGEVYVIRDLTLPVLSSDISEFSAVTGGTQTLCVAGGASEANSLYLILGSANGTSPGTSVGGAMLPLQNDWYFQLLLNAPNAVVFGSFGFLDAGGFGSASLTIPGSVLPPEFTNLTLYHACLVYNPTLGQITRVSGPVTLRIDA